jgi:hypothetical protein
MGYPTTQLKSEAEVATAFAESVLATMNRKPKLHSIRYDLGQYRAETGLPKLSLRREQNLRAAAQKLGLQLIVTPDELCFFRATGDEYNRTESLTKMFRKKRDELE